MLSRFPDEHDFSIGFKPGVRFFFKYNVIENHKDFTNDGIHPAKIKNELSLTDYLHCCVIPEIHKTEFLDVIPSTLTNRIIFIKNDCNDIWDWTEKVYDLICKL